MTIERELTLIIKKYIPKDEILLIIGPRQAGKTTVLRQIEGYMKLDKQNCFFLNLEDPDYLSLLNKSPKNLFEIFPIDLQKNNFLLIDEIQYLNNPSNFLKYYYDEYKGKIKIIASGSSAFYLDRKFKDSLVGRKFVFTLYTLSFHEFLSFKIESHLPQVNLTNLTLSEKEKIRPYYLEYLIYGGYPRVVLSPIEEKLDILRDIAYSYIKKDIFESNIRQDEIFYKLFKILASQIGSLIAGSELANTLDVSKTSIENYLYIMQKSFHILLIRPFFKNVRKELTKMPKAYFIDLGLRNFFKSDFRRFHERDDIGQLLENAFVLKLLEKHDRDEIKFWHTTDQKEVDFVVEEKTAYEVKVKTKGIKTKIYQPFRENYPDIPLNFITLEHYSKENFPFPTYEPWEI
jgi:hypothetical protein